MSNLKKVTFSEETKWRTDLEKTYVPINPTTIRYGKKYCTVTSITLRVCKAITIHKAQGMSIGPGKSFESVIVSLPEKGERTNLS